MPLCRVNGCDQDQYTRVSGLCPKHFSRWRRHGDTSVLLPGGNGGGHGAVELSEKGAEVLRGLWEHSRLTTTQVREMFMPTTIQKWALGTLARLESNGYVERDRSHRTHVWFLTPKGTAVSQDPTLPPG